jgi:hypothetical protein
MTRAVMRLTPSHTAGARPRSARIHPDILDLVMVRSRLKKIFVMAALLAFVLAACHKEEQGVVGVVHKAESAEKKVQANQTELDQERAQLEQIPLPTKSLYIDIHDPAAWKNPFLSVGPDTITLRILLPDANPSPAGQGSLLRPEAARRQELELRSSDLDKAVAAIPAGAWRYGRVIAVAESPSAAPKDRPMVRRNVEAAIKQLNDLGVVVEEWPSR